MVAVGWATADYENDNDNDNDSDSDSDERQYRNRCLGALGRAQMMVAKIQARGPRGMVS
jgi:hypothetical protein